MSTTQQLLLAALFLMLSTIWRQRKCWVLIWQLSGWRGILYQPLLWFLVLFIMDPKRLMLYLPKIRKHFKSPTAIYAGHCVWLYIDYPSGMEQVFNAPECIDKTFLQDGFLTRKGVLHAKGQKWKIRRKQLNPAFSTNILLSFFGTFNAVGNRLQLKFEDLIGDKVKFKEVEDMLGRAVLEVACRTTMGTDLNFVDGDAAGIARTYKKLMEISAVRTIKPWLQNDFLFGLLDSKLYACGNECNKLLEEFVSNIVQRKHCEWKKQQQRDIVRATTKTEQPWKNLDVDADNIIKQQVEENHCNNTNSQENRNDHRQQQQHQPDETTQSWQQQKRRIFIEQIFHLADSGELTLQDIMDESQSMIMVAFETVSNSILLALLCLAIHPECQDKLRHEINETFPTAFFNTKEDDCSRPSTSDISNEHLKQMSYLDMVVNESQRLLTTIPMNSRFVSRDFQLIPKVEEAGVQQNRKAVNVPAGTIILLDIFNMQRNRHHWGSRSKQFYPEHFAVDEQVADDVSESEKIKQRHPYAFVPFSKGLRSCVGSRYSIWLTKILLIKIIHCYEFSTTTKLKDLLFVEGISLKFQNCDSITFSIRKVQHNNKAKLDTAE